MTYKMRRSDRALSEREAWDIVEAGLYGVLSLAGADGAPYGVPLSYAVLDGDIYFHCAREGRKLDCIAHEPRVSFCVAGTPRAVYTGGFSTYYESAIVEGRAELVRDDALRRRALRALCERYLPEHMDKAEGDITRSLAYTAVVRITPVGITGKAKRERA